MARGVRLHDRLDTALHELFGFREFNPGQRDVVTRVMNGEDTLAILATGAGKSLCYQLPALLLDGTTIVVSPLIALMKDQLDMLRERGFHNNLALNSTLGEEQELAARERIATGNVKIVFVTPEKLEDESFLEILAENRYPALRRRRSALHQSMGSRLPAGLPRTGPHHPGATESRRFSPLRRPRRPPCAKISSCNSAFRSAHTIGEGLRSARTCGTRSFAQKTRPPNSRVSRVSSNSGLDGTGHHLYGHD